MVRAAPAPPAPQGAPRRWHQVRRGGFIATLLCLAPGTHYELTVRRSFADYLVRWLCVAGE